MKKETNEETAKRINELFKKAPKGTGKAIEDNNYFGKKEPAKKR